jgi:hypothetical protein
MARTRIRTPEQFNATLVQRVRSGVAHVIAANEYNSLPLDLRNRYYPLFRRADTTYRLKKEYMRARQDPDPNTTPPVIVAAKRVSVPTQFSKSPIRTVPWKGVVKTDPETTDTEASTKSLSRLAKETGALLRGRVGVRTQYSRF